MYYNYIKCKVIYLGIEQSIKTRGKPLAEAPNRQLAVFPTIRRPCTDFLTGLSACLPACLSVCLSVPACVYLSMPIVCIYLYLSSVPPVCATAYLSVIWGKGRPDRRLRLIRLIVLIQIVLYGRSLAVHSNGGRLGYLPRRP